jgi:hypothetical protein
VTTGLRVIVVGGRVLVVVDTAVSVVVVIGSDVSGTVVSGTVVSGTISDPPLNASGGTIVHPLSSIFHASMKHVPPPFS